MTLKHLTESVQLKRDSVTMFILGNITGPTAICQMMTLHAPITLDCQANTLQVSDQHFSERPEIERFMG